jgi:hypothetical protein
VSLGKLSNPGSNFIPSALTNPETEKMEFQTLGEKINKILALKITFLPQTFTACCSFKKKWLIMRRARRYE